MYINAELFVLYWSAERFNNLSKFTQLICRIARNQVLGLSSSRAHALTYAVSNTLFCLPLCPGCVSYTCLNDAFFSVPGVHEGFPWWPGNPVLRVTGHIRAYFDRQRIYYNSLWTDDWPYGILGGIICQLCKTASHNSPSYIKTKVSLCPGNVMIMKLLFFLPYLLCRGSSDIVILLSASQSWSSLIGWHCSSD